MRCVTKFHCLIQQLKRRQFSECRYQRYKSAKYRCGFIRFLVIVSLFFNFTIFLEAIRFEESIYWDSLGRKIYLPRIDLHLASRLVGNIHSKRYMLLTCYFMWLIKTADWMIGTKQFSANVSNECRYQRYKSTKYLSFSIFQFSWELFALKNLLIGIT